MEFSEAAIIKHNHLILENKTGSWRSFKPVILQEKCVRCGICWMFCPDRCFKKIKDNSKYQFKFIINYDYCKGCLICLKECPFNAIFSLPEKK